MKRNRVLFFTRILYIIFIIGTIISLFIVYNDLDSSIAYNFVMIYGFFTLFMLLYIPLTTIVNLRKLKLTELKAKILKFIILFILFGAINYGLDYIFRPLKIDLLREFSTALGLAFGISFIDVIFLKDKNN